MGLILFIISVLLGSIILPAGVIYGFFKCFYKRQIGAAFINVNNKFSLFARALDEYGNLVCAELLQATVTKKTSVHPFGIDGLTISEVTRQNYDAGTLTGFGKCLAKILILFKDTAFIHK